MTSNAKRLAAICTISAVGIWCLPAASAAAGSSGFSSTASALHSVDARHAGVLPRAELPRHHAGRLLPAALPIHRAGRRLSPTLPVHHAGRLLLPPRRTRSRPAVRYGTGGFKAAVEPQHLTPRHIRRDCSPCYQGWLGYSSPEPTYPAYLNRSIFYGSQGYTDYNIGVGGIILGGCPTNGCSTGGEVPSTLALDTSNCDTGAGGCVYYMEGDITIPNGGTLTIDSGVTLQDMDTGFWPSNSDGTPAGLHGASGSGIIYVQSGGKLVVQAGATLAFSNHNPGTQPSGAIVQIPSAPGIIVQGGGTLDMQGTSASPITLTSANTSQPLPNWGGVLFDDSSSGTLNHVIKEDGGASGYPGAWYGNNGYPYTYNAGIFVGNASPLIENTTVEDTSGNGIEMGSPSPSPTLTNVTLTGNGVNLNPTAFTSEADYAIHYDDVPASTANITGLTVSGNGHDVAGIAVSGPVRYNVQLDDPGVPILIGAQDTPQDLQTGDCCGNSMLTVGSGTTLQFNGDKLHTGGSGNGANIAGTAADPVTLEGTSNTPGSWGGIVYHDEVNSQLTVTYATFDNASTAVSITGNNAGGTDIEHSTIENSSGDGIDVANEYYANDETLKSDTFQGNGGYAIYYETRDGEPPSIDGTSISGSGNGDDAIGVVSGGYNGAGSWNSRNFPIIVGAQGGANVPDMSVNANLTITAGTTVKFNGDGISGSSTLDLAGVSGDQVTLEGVGASPGSWGGIKSPQVTATYAVIDDASTGVAAQAGSDIENSTIENSSGDGIDGDAPTFTLKSDTIKGNLGWAVYYQTNLMPNIDGTSLTLSGNGHDAIGVDTSQFGAYANSAIWSSGQIPIIVGAQGGSPPLDLALGTQYGNGGSLTINGGTTVEFNGDGLAVYTNSTLDLAGTSAGGVTLEGVQGTPGSWAGIKYDGSSLTADYATIDDAATGIASHGSAADLNRSTIENSSGDGVDDYADGVTMTSDTIDTNAGWPLYYPGEPNRNFGSLVAANVDVTGVTATGNGQNAIGVQSDGSYLISPGTWNSPDLSIVVGDGANPVPTNSPSFTVEAGQDGNITLSGSLDIAAGTTVEFNGGSGLWLNGSTLDLAGASGRPVVLTGLQKQPGALGRNHLEWLLSIAADRRPRFHQRRHHRLELLRRRRHRLAHELVHHRIELGRRRQCRDRRRLQV